MFFLHFVPKLTINFLFCLLALTTEGIFRRSPLSTTIDELKRKFNQGMIGYDLCKERFVI